jgi:xanthine dehydrogenase accessory factor
MKVDRPLILLRGGGDLATGVAARLHRSGFAVVVAEIAKPLAVRRLVALAEAIYAGEVRIEDLVGRRVEGPQKALSTLEDECIPVLVDPEAQIAQDLRPMAVVDCRMLKDAQPADLDQASLLIGLGPGFTGGINCHAVVETNRGHNMGRVLWKGSAEADTGVPEPVSGHAVDRVLRAPVAGEVHAHAALGTLVKMGELIAAVADAEVLAPFNGALRGLLHDGIQVSVGKKIGDLDPRNQVEFCFQISDKALAVGGGVLEALLSQSAIRAALGA